jgi:hypothetical protein
MAFPNVGGFNPPPTFNPGGFSPQSPSFPPAPPNSPYTQGLGSDLGNPLAGLGGGFPNFPSAPQPSGNPLGGGPLSFGAPSGQGSPFPSPQPGGFPGLGGGLPGGLQFPPPQQPSPFGPPPGGNPFGPPGGAPFGAPPGAGQAFNMYG